MKTWQAALAAVVMTGAMASSAAQAHYIWLERNGVAVRAFFGEWEGDLREVSGGTLDRITGLTAFGTDRAKTLSVTKEANHFAIKGAGKGDVRAIVDRAPVDDKANGGKTKTMFQAKEGRADTKPVFDLELVPVMAKGDTFVLMLRGTPVAKADVHVFGPPKWGKELTTDENGKVTIPMPWAGRYVAEIIHVEQTPGGEGEGAYNRIRHVSTTSFTTTKGIAWKTMAAK
jgi:hypothetical protein